MRESAWNEEKTKVDQNLGTLGRDGNVTDISNMHITCTIKKQKLSKYLKLILCIIS